MSRRRLNSLDDLTTSEYRKDINQFIPNDKRFFKLKNYDIYFDLIVSEKLALASFENCVFYNIVNFTNVDIEKSFDFKYCTFEENVIFNNVKIAEKSRFWESEFNKDAKFHNVSFKNLADFFKVKFNETIIFYKVDFLGTTVFTETLFKENVLFTYTKIADVIIFMRTLFSAGLDLSQAIITGKINIHNSDLLNFPDIVDINDNDSYRHAIENDGIITRNNKRETYRILKKFAKEDYNQFKYLEYSKLENEVYYRQLKSEKIKRFNNYVIFVLNKFSNDHNMSWLIGVTFTTIVGFIFFYSSLISTSCIKASYKIDSELFIFYLGKYFEFLSPLHSMDLFLYEHPNTGTIILDFFGRIFVGYGIYQTIQAFRKHKG